MPLPRYGVAIGTFVSFARDPQDQFGHWYHGHLTIDTPAGTYRSALDVDTPSRVGISYRLSPSLSLADLGPVGSLPDGWHALASTSSSGALDYLRSPLFRDRLLYRWPVPSPMPDLPGGLRRPAPPWIGRLSRFVPPRLSLLRPWVTSSGDNALAALEAEFPGAKRIFVFGEHFENGRGVHDVHMNQGDPAGSQWWTQNGTWQDGAVLLQRPDDSVFAWQVRFNSQAMSTDDEGHPA